MTEKSSPTFWKYIRSTPSGGRRDKGEMLEDVNGSWIKALRSGKHKVTCNFILVWMTTDCCQRGD